MTDATDATDTKAATTADTAAPPDATLLRKPALPPEIGGPQGPEPTRYGDWEVKGRCSDF